MESESSSSSGTARKSRRLEAGSLQPAVPGVSGDPSPAPTVLSRERLGSGSFGTHTSGGSSSSSSSSSGDSGSSNKQDGAFVVRVFRFLNKAFAEEVIGSEVLLVPTATPSSSSSSYRSGDVMDEDEDEPSTPTPRLAIATQKQKKKKKYKKENMGKRGRGRGARFGGDEVKCRCHRKRCRTCGNCELRHCICAGGPVEAKAMKRQERLKRKKSSRRGGGGSKSSEGACEREGRISERWRHHDRIVPYGENM